jgi:nucleotide-binding universal stress UspA family protein
MFHKVLTATARPLEIDESVLSAGRIAQYNNAGFLILHVVEPDPAGSRNEVKHFRTGEKIVCDDAYREEIKEKLQTSYSVELKLLDKFEVRIALGTPWVEILKWAGEEAVDLIVLGARTATADDDNKERIGTGGTVGSTAEGVIRHERCPVMIVNEPISDSRVVFESVMVCIDFSPSCNSAFRFAVDLAQKRGSRLHLFHMLPVPPHPQYSQTKYKVDIREKRKRLAGKFRDQVPDPIEVEIHTWGGVHPDIEILKCAQRNNADLIIMGSHTKLKGKLQESRWYVGSAVERVSAKSACPVVVITDPKALEQFNLEEIISFR